MVKSPTLNIQFTLHTKKWQMRVTNKNKKVKFCAVFLIYTHVNYHKTWFHNNENKYKNNPYMLFVLMLVLMLLVLMLQQFWRL